MPGNVNQSTIGILPVAGDLVHDLAEAKVRYGVYKNTRSLDAGLSGLTDLDILVSADDEQAFRRVVLALNGVRGVPSQLYDNSVAGREDWFVPDPSGGFLHLDTSFGLHIGRKFRKRYTALRFEDVTNWCLKAAPDMSIPFVAPHDEARIAVLRSAFRLPLWPGRTWVPADGDSSRVLEQVFAQGQEVATLRYRFGVDLVECRVRRRSDAFELEANAIRQMRRAIRAENGQGLLAAPIDFITDLGRHLACALVSKWRGAGQGSSIAWRRLESQGIIVALVGPDGVGKSTQSAKLAATFGKKFRCSTVYLGSNDGGWTKFRQAPRYHPLQNDEPSMVANLRQPEKRSSIHILGSAIWRLAVAVQRVIGLRKARRLAGSGAIVIADRWPQTLRYGYFDGPSVPPPATLRLACLLSRIEHRIYHWMDRYKPTLTVHLDCDFETSNARKPGDIRKAEFERRIELMQEMRRIDPHVVLVDARQDMDAVGRVLTSLVWQAAYRANQDYANPTMSYGGHMTVAASRKAVDA